MKIEKQQRKHMTAEQVILCDKLVKLFGRGLTAQLLDVKPFTIDMCMYRRHGQSIACSKSEADKNIASIFGADIIDYIEAMNHV